MKPTLLLTLSLVSLLVGAQITSAIHLGRDIVQPASPDLGDGCPGHASAHSTMRSKLQKRSDMHLPLDGGGGIRSRLRGGGCPGFYIMPKTHMPVLVLAPGILSALGLILNPTWCLESFTGIILHGRFASKEIDFVRFAMKNAGVRMLGLVSAISFLMYRDLSLGVPDKETLAGAFGVFSATMASLLLLLGMSSGKEIYALGCNQYFPYIWSAGFAICAGLFFTETAVRPAGYFLSLIGLYHGMVGLIAPEVPCPHQSPLDTRNSAAPCNCQGARLSCIGADPQGPLCGHRGDLNSPSLYSERVSLHLMTQYAQEAYKDKNSLNFPGEHMRFSNEKEKD